MKFFSIFFAVVLLSMSIFVLPRNQVIIPVQADIFYEISKGNKRAVSTWLKSKPDLSMRNEQGQSLLTVAVLTGDHKMVKEILKSSIDINALDQYEKTALDWACEREKGKIVMLLVQAGAKVTSRSNELWVKKIVSSYQDYWFYYFGLKLIPSAFVIIVATLVGASICGWLGLSVLSASAGWSTYIILSTCCAAPLLLLGWPIWLAGPTSWFWTDVMIGTQGMVAIGVPAVVPVALFITLIGYGMGYTISMIRSSSRSYYVDKSKFARISV